MDDETLAAAPFKLDGAAIAWVRETFAALSPRDKLTQLFNLRSVGSDPAALDAIKAFKPGGVTRVPGRRRRRRDRADRRVSRAAQTFRS